MAIYQPTYRDPKTGKLKKSALWWYAFTFDGRRIQESSKSTRKTVARTAEENRKRELQETYNGVEDNRSERLRPIGELAEEYLEGYRLRHSSASFAEYALGHVTRLVGKTMKAEVSPKTITAYQSARLREKASPKTINEEVGFLLRLLGEQGDAIRAKMRRDKTLKLDVGRSVARAFTPAEKAALLAEAKKRRSPSIYPALMLALHAGMRDAEIRHLQWLRGQGCPWRVAHRRPVRQPLAGVGPWWTRRIMSGNSPLSAFSVGCYQVTRARARVFSLTRHK